MVCYYSSNFANEQHSGNDIALASRFEENMIHEHLCRCHSLFFLGYAEYFFLSFGNNSTFREMVGSLPFLVKFGEPDNHGLSCLKKKSVII